MLPEASCQEKSEDDGRQTGYQYFQPHIQFFPADNLIGPAFTAVNPVERPESRKIQNDNRHDGAELDNDQKHFPEFLPHVELQELLRQNHMSG